MGWRVEPEGTLATYSLKLSWISVCGGRWPARRARNARTNQAISSSKLLGPNFSSNGFG